MSVENEYTTRIPNDLYERIIFFDFSKRQAKLVHFLVRYTIGFGRTEADLSMNFVSEKTGVSLRDAYRTKEELCWMNVWVKHPKLGKHVFGLNTDYTTWKPWVKHPNRVIHPKLIGQNTQKLLGELPTHRKENKERKQRKDPPPPHFDYQPFEEIWNRFATKIGARTVMSVVNWSDKRKDAVRRAAKVPAFDFRVILTRMFRSPFMQRSAKEGVRWLSFDWVVHPKNWRKVLEGHYDDSNPNIAKPEEDYAPFKGSTPNP